jgi:SAM-dependent methyltransferase
MHTSIAAGIAFDSMASFYDRSFTGSLIGRAQRNAVWRVLGETFFAGDRILELNCGTGEDAIFLGRRGVSLVGYDASKRMIEVANRRLQDENALLDITFEVQATEELGSIGGPFDGVLSNFSGLNCIKDLRPTAVNLAALTVPGATAIFCLSTRFCAWESIYYGLMCHLRKATRRWSGTTLARLEGVQLPVYYPTVTQIQRTFSPFFRLTAMKGIGVLVPPSYVEGWAQRHRRVFRILEGFDRTVSQWPVFRIIGDHVLLVFERTGS